MTIPLVLPADAKPPGAAADVWPHLADRLGRPVLLLDASRGGRWNVGVLYVPGSAAVGGRDVVFASGRNGVRPDAVAYDVRRGTTGSRPKKGTVRWAIHPAGDGVKTDTDAIVVRRCGFRCFAALAPRRTPDASVPLRRAVRRTLRRHLGTVVHTAVRAALHQRAAAPPDGIATAEAPRPT